MSLTKRFLECVEDRYEASGKAFPDSGCFSDYDGYDEWFDEQDGADGFAELVESCIEPDYDMDKHDRDDAEYV